MIYRMKDLLCIILLGSVFFSSCQERNLRNGEKVETSDSPEINQGNLKPKDLKAHKVIRMHSGDIEVVFVDNSSFGEKHRAGYNGIAELSHSKKQTTIRT